MQGSTGSSLKHRCIPNGTRENLDQALRGDRIVIGLDAKDGYVATHGWLETSELTAIDLGKGPCRCRGEDIHLHGYRNRRDAVRTQRRGERELAKATGASVIASGGVSSLQDLKTLKESGVGGAICGKSLYTGKFTVAEAIKEVTSC